VCAATAVVRFRFGSSNALLILYRKVWIVIYLSHATDKILNRDFVGVKPITVRARGGCAFPRAVNREEGEQTVVRSPMHVIHSAVAGLTAILITASSPHSTA